MNVEGSLNRINETGKEYQEMKALNVNDGEAFRIMSMTDIQLKTILKQQIIADSFRRPYRSYTTKEYVPRGTTKRRYGSDRQNK